MRIGLSESLEEWAERVCKEEYKLALRHYNNGSDINTVMEAMAIRIQNKILHPIFIELKKSKNIDNST
jgi:glutamyl-tRNA reductase